MITYNFEKVCLPSKLEKEIRESEILTALSHITGTASEVDVHFRAELSQEDETILEGIVEAHVPVSNDPKDSFQLTLSEKTAKAIYTEFYQASMAVDRENIDQNLSGTDWTIVEATRVLWDFSENYDIANHNFKIPFDGIYAFDGQFKISNFSNVDYVEIAVFKRGSPDDYWFIIDKSYVDGKSEINLSGMTFFDFYKDEEYCLKIKLYPVLPLVPVTAKFIGDDDYSAWGLSIHRPIEVG